MHEHEQKLELNLEPGTQESRKAQSRKAKTKTIEFDEPLDDQTLPILGLALLMVLAYVMTFGFQALAQRFHWPVVQGIADTIFNGGMLTKAFLRGEVWRPLTMAFLHAGMFHLFGNVVSFYSLARLCSIAFARGNWMIIFFGSSVIGAIATILIQPDQQTVGASIGIMGLLGALISAELRKLKVTRELLPADPLVPLKTLLFVLVLQLALEHLIPNVSHTGHIAGVIVGAAIGCFLPLSGGVRLYASRTDLIRIVDVKTVTVRIDDRPRKVVQSLTYEKPTLGPNDFLFLEQGDLNDYQRGWFSRKLKPGKASLASETNLASQTAGVAEAIKAHVVATRYAVPGFDNLFVLAPEDESASSQKTRRPIWQSIVLLSLHLLTWSWLFQSWSPMMTLPRADLQWLNFLPAYLAEPAIFIGSILGALIVSYFAAELLVRLFGSLIVSFMAGLLSALRDGSAK